MSKNKRWVVTATGDRSLSEVRKDLAKAGFEVDEVFEEIGSIVGSGDKDAGESFRTIAGVADVSPEEPIDIGPPDSSTTW